MPGNGNYTNIVVREHQRGHSGMKNVVIIVLLGLLLWFGSVIVRLENYRYASFLGMCSEYPSHQPVERRKCFENTQTRTSPFWHLAYALGFM